MLCAGQPTYVSSLTATKIDAGSSHTCALDSGGNAWCWGDNSDGQVGGTITEPGRKASRPVRVNGGLTFASLGAGDNETCGTLTIGGLYCWGNHINAAAFIASVGFTEIAVASDHSCGNIGSNAWLCWGANGSGQLAADPQTTPSAPPFVWVHAVDGSSHLSVSAVALAPIRARGWYSASAGTAALTATSRL